MARDMCQSCGIPIDKDAQGGATLADGSRTRAYCSMCMKDGEFLWQGDDVRAYQAFVVDQMVRDGFWRPWAWLLTRPIPRLERWRKAAS